jgi:RNA polymerase sigma-70 factor (ECF subfamily)
MVKRAPETGDWRGLSELREDVERTLARSCRDRNELDDMVQETLLRAATFRRSLQDHTCLRPWVLRIAWNVLRDHVRRERRLKRAEVGEGFLEEIEGRESGPSVLAETRKVEIGGVLYDDADVLELLCRLLPELSELERELFQAYYGEGLGCRRAASRLEVTTQTVKMRLFRLRRKLRRALHKHRQLALTSCAAQAEAVA